MGTKKSLLNFETFYWIEKNISGPLLVSRTGEVGCSKCCWLKCQSVR